MKLLLVMITIITNIIHDSSANDINFAIHGSKTMFLKTIKDKCYQNATQEEFDEFISLTDNATTCVKTKLTASPIFVTPLDDFKDNIQVCIEHLTETLEGRLPEESKDWPQLNFDIIFSLIEFAYEWKEQFLFLAADLRSYVEGCFANFKGERAKTELNKCFVGYESKSFVTKVFCENIVSMTSCILSQINERCVAEPSIDKIKVDFFAALTAPCREYVTTEDPIDSLLTLLPFQTPPRTP